MVRRFSAICGYSDKWKVAKIAGEAKYGVENGFTQCYSVVKNAHSHNRG